MRKKGSLVVVQNRVVVKLNRGMMYKTLQNTIEEISKIEISEERKGILRALIEYIQSKKDDGVNILLNFICTHNSRRSHLSQIWAQTMATYCGVRNVYCFSGGTEATSLFPKVFETLQKQGFEGLKISETDNPVYAFKFSELEAPLIAFSKKYNHQFNPQSDFGAILTCDSADENCPVVLGAEVRFPIKYQDPKISDGTSEMDSVYWKRSYEIASEMYFVFSNIN